MNNFKFAEQSKIQSFTDMNEALLEASKLVVEPVEVTIGDIEVTPEGKIKVGSDERLTTRIGLLSYCNILGIPSIFAKAIPDDLLLTNIKRLTQERATETAVFLERSDNTLASIVKSPYSEISYSDILGRFSEKNPVNIQMSEQLLKVMFKFDSLKVPGLEENIHSLYVSDSLLASLVKDISLQAVSGLYKTQCSNSFIMPILGKLKANYMKAPEKRLNLFADAFECYDNEIVATVFRNLSQNTTHLMKKHQFKYVWESFKGLTSEGEADLLFHIDEETRKFVLAEARKYLAEVKKARILNLIGPYSEDTIYKLFDVANDITFQAHNLEGIESVKVEILGGTVLQWMLFNN